MGSAEKSGTARLTGALIGLARAAEGNEDKITADTNRVLLDGLTAQSDPDALISRISAEKRKLIPMCYECAAPCGRHNDYNMEELWTEEKEIRELKMLLLCSSREIARTGAEDPQALAFLYKALLMLGITGYRQAHLLPVLQEAGALLCRCEMHL